MTTSFFYFTYFRWGIGAGFVHYRNLQKDAAKTIDFIREKCYDLINWINMADFGFLIDIRA